MEALLCGYRKLSMSAAIFNHCDKLNHFVFCQIVKYLIQNEWVLNG